MKNLKAKHMAVGNQGLFEVVTVTRKGLAETAIIPDSIHFILQDGKVTSYPNGCCVLPDEVFEYNTIDWDGKLCIKKELDTTAKEPYMLADCLNSRIIGYNLVIPGELAGIEVSSTLSSVEKRADGVPLKYRRSYIVHNLGGLVFQETVGEAAADLHRMEAEISEILTKEIPEVNALSAPIEARMKKARESMFKANDILEKIKCRKGYFRNHMDMPHDMFLVENGLPEGIVAAETDFGDFIVCTECGCKQLVKEGGDTCIVCGTEGCNLWVDGKKEETYLTDIEAEGYVTADDEMLEKLKKAVLARQEH